jgi:hypothetical protein
MFHYYQHIADILGSSPDIYFTPESTFDSTNPWRSLAAINVAPAFDPTSADMLVLGGLDWLALEPWPGIDQVLPIVNLIQHVRHGDVADPRHAFLQRRAFRIAVSPEVESALRRHASLNGPLRTIANGVETDGVGPAIPWSERPVDIAVMGAKAPQMAVATAALLERAAVVCRIFTDQMPRHQFLENLAQCRVAVVIPHPSEGFFLPALEAMALGCVVVCPDCVGNRSFCIDGQSALVPPFNPQALAQAALHGLNLSSADRQGMTSAVRTIVDRHSIDAERQALRSALTAWRLLPDRALQKHVNFSR